jgi:phenylacetate-CoA ligase
MSYYLDAAYSLYNLLRHTRWDRNRLAAYQKKSLRKVANYAFENVPFYHRRFRSIGIKPEDIKGPDDLNKLPVLSKEEIRNNLNDMISNEFDKKSLRVMSTSGSTGHPLKIYASRGEDAFRKAKHLRANIICGQRPRDRWVTITSPTHFADVGKIQRISGFFAPRFVSVFDDTTAQISALEKARPAILDGYSSSLLLAAREIERMGVQTIRPRMVFGGAELSDRSSRRFIEGVFNTPFYDQYATVEMERMAWQCVERSGYHIDADAMIIQFLDDAGDEVSPGESGRIVCTSLFSYAMPFVRYDVGDVGVPSEETCSCGISFPLMKMLEGRRDSILVLPNNRFLSPRSFTIAMNTFELVEHVDRFRLSQKRKDFLEIQIQLKDNLVDEKTLETRLIAHLLRVLRLHAKDITIQVKFVESFASEKTGKFTIVTSDLTGVS